MHGWNGERKRNHEHSFSTRQSAQTFFPVMEAMPGQFAIVVDHQSLAK
jgi:hypothetical protein